MRGDSAVGRAEAVSFGALMATIMGGSVVLYLAAVPFVYSEDFAWSIPLTVGSLFALLGVLERPTKWRILASGVLILCTNLDRSPPGWACSIAAIAIAGWFALGRDKASNRRWALPMFAVGMVPFLASCVVTYAKFGIPVGLPMADQVWATVNAHRRYFLAANGGKAFSFAFLPSTLSAYFQPFGIRFSGLFPFISPPGGARPMARRRGDGPELPHRQLHGHQPTPPPPRLLGSHHSLSAPRDRTGAADEDHPFRCRSRSGRRTAVGIHLAAVPRGSDALFHHRQRHRPHRHMAPVGGPSSAREGSRGRLHRRHRHLLCRCELCHCDLSGCAMVDDPERPVRLRREVSEHRFAGEQCLARVNPAVLGAGGTALRYRQLLGALPLDRQYLEGRTRATDRALHVDAGRTVLCVHPYHRLHVQSPGERLHPARDADDLREEQTRDGTVIRPGFRCNCTYTIREPPSAGRHRSGGSSRLRRQNCTSSFRWS